MELEVTLAEIATRLREDGFPNEQAISLGIVVPVLQDLGWNTRNPALVWPEYQTGEGRADFALCHPPSKPAIFIEVKQPGRAEDAVRQALAYAFQTGVPFIVLTDGRTWGFYLPAAQGSYEDRCVYKLDLFERTPAEAAETLRRYLDRERVESGEALKTAGKDYSDRERRSRASARIPEAWRELVEKGDEDLVELLASAVEAKAGVRPDKDDVVEFLKRLGNTSPVTPPEPPERYRGQVILRGKTYPYKTAKEAMVIVLRELAKGDRTFLERCSQDPRAHGTTRRYIARTPEELYPRDPKRYDSCESLPGGWLVATNNDNALKETIIKLAAEVAGLTFGTDLIVKL